MLRFKGWHKWQGDAIYDRKRKRKDGGRGARSISLSYIAIATNMDDEDGDFRRFAALVGGPILARGYLVMALSWVGRNACLTGEIRCTPPQFGARILSDLTGETSRATGEKIYRALVASGLAEEVSEPENGESSPPTSPPTSPPVGGEPSPPSSPPIGGRRGEERRGEENPPSPFSATAGGSASPSSDERPLSPTETAMLEAVIDCLCKHAGCDDAEQQFGYETRKARKAGLLSPDDARELIAKFGARKGIRESVGVARNNAKEMNP